MDLAAAMWGGYSPLDANSFEARSLAPRRVTPLIIDPLPVEHRRGLIGVAITSILSTISTGVLFIVFTYRLIYWRKYYPTYLGYNQFLILIYNLLLADFQQAIGFFLSIHWVITDQISYRSRMCFAQGWLLQIGDPASGLFVLSIAVHTFAMVLMGRKLSHRWFITCVCGVWAFAVAITLIPTLRFRNHTYVPSGAWCWIDENFDNYRLWTHYLWIFVSEFGSVVLYALLFFHLRHQVAQSALLGRGQKEHLRRLRRVIGYMVLYPIAYIVLSLPLAAGRMMTARGGKLSVTYFCTAGAVIASSGFVDVVMYTLTRRALLLDSELSNGDRFYHSQRVGHSHTTTVTTENKQSRLDNSILHRREVTETDTRVDRDGSTDNIVQPIELNDLGKVYQKTTIEITTEPAEDTSTSPDSSVNETRMPPPSRTWHRR
ncbi:integral membrane protein [Histoplasma ohiense]|nr:integral membrane protein [Histoplasma ohiense (nom. inval.)]